MTEPTTPVDAGDGDDPQEPQEPQTFTAEYVKELRDEAKARRLQGESLQLKLDKIEADRVAAEAAKLKEQGEFEKLADDRQLEIDRLTSYETQVKGLVEAAEISNAEFIKTVPEERRGLIPTDYDALKLQTYLNINRDSLIGQSYVPPSTNGGAGTRQPSGGQFKPLTSAEKAMADKMKVSHEDYQKSKATGLQKTR